MRVSDARVFHIGPASTAILHWGRRKWRGHTRQKFEKEWGGREGGSEIWMERGDKGRIGSYNRRREIGAALYVETKRERGRGEREGENACVAHLTVLSLPLCFSLVQYSTSGSCTHDFLVRRNRELGTHTRESESDARHAYLNFSVTESPG